jgi:hypothetical protein
VFAGDMKFDPEKAKNAESFAKKILNTKLKKINKLGIKKLVILECFGEYVTSTETTNSASSQRYSGWKTSSKSTIEFDNDYYSFITNRVYAAVKEAFENNGIEIVTIDELNKSKVYTNFNLEEEKKGRGVSAGMFKPTKVEKTQKVSATGLGIFPSNPIKMIKLIVNMGNIVHDVDADGMLQIHYKVLKGKKAKPIVGGFQILMTGGIVEKEVGFKGHKKMSYSFKAQSEPLITQKKGIITQNDVIEGKKGPLDIKNMMTL